MRLADHDESATPNEQGSSSEDRSLYG